MRRIDDRLYTPVETSSTFEETLNRLGTAIRLGVLGPGERLPPERELAERMRISRSTLRQALGVLTDSGHLVAVRGRSGGTFVAQSPPVSIPVDGSLLSRFDEIIDFRMMLEMGVAAVVAERGRPEHLAELEAALEAQAEVEDGDAVGYLRSDARFHVGLARAADNARLERLLVETQAESVNVIIPRIRAGGMPPEMVKQSLAQHRAILDAIQAGDSALASHRVREHMRVFDAAMRQLGG